MREIKFRAWDNQKGMTYSGSVSFDGSWQIDVKGGVTVLMQYTGLKDKNGKEIYEGDIVMRANYKIPRVVEWIMNNGISGFIVVGAESNLHQASFDRVEVIGNIYENSELIKPS